MDNLWEGTTENDVITAGKTDDTIIGGAGNDKLTGGSGSDTYIFNIGDGHDTIIEASIDPTCSCVDKIQLGAGIGIEDLRYSADGDDLIINFRGNDSDSIRIVGAKTGESAGIESICFTDGTELEFTTALSIVELTKETGNYLPSVTTNTQIINGHDGMDTIMLTGAGSVIVDGGAGMDRMILSGKNVIAYGGAGMDFIQSTISQATLIGGTGRDTLIGSHLGDTYIFNKGDGIDYVRDSLTPPCIVNEGSDTIKFGKGITKEDISFFMQKEGLIISYGENDKITVIEQHVSKHAIETVQLASGSSLSSAEINQIVADLSNYASDHGLDFTSVEDVKNNQELMNIVTAAWDN
ncbi:calcium-binding protein [Halodesulfovibrio spirochaetisodalis]|uniref:Haemolysin-type calcium binding-related domain-containing protein n=1 Tax=Halodesulfovibrio spirochaetisodalis TaxID=1560234 RepID=A0A1B7XAL7_9BACT|nr:calcium-binding protein [Halodesulfovibrio spirochaetisodalis]OBQ46376.1 hypothetical protein SP90_12645 [Halodesulfovibrio spirochaetisodalis]